MPSLICNDYKDTHCVTGMWKTDTGGKKTTISLKLKPVEHNEHKVGTGRKWELWERIYNEIFLGWEGAYQSSCLFGAGVFLQ